MDVTVEIVDPSERWNAEFEGVAARLRAGFGDVALRIDHIGSTAVPGLAAKDVIDVQVTVESLDDPSLPGLLDAAGFTMNEFDRDRCPPWVDGGEAVWRKRYAREREGRRVHVHIRERGSPNQRYALLFRDYLRAVPAAASAYEEAKRVLAEMAPDRETYVEAKDRAIFDLVSMGAEQWAAATRWEPGD